MYAFYHTFNQGAHLLGVAVHDYGVHMYNGLNSELFAYFALHVVNHLVRFHKVAVCGHLCVEADYRPAGAVVVVNKVVYAQNVFVLQSKFINRVGKLLAHRPSKKGSLCGLYRAPARLENEYGNNHARHAVYGECGVLPCNQRGKNHARRYHVGNRIRGRCGDRGGVYALSYLSVKVKQPEFDEDCGNQHAHCRVRKFCRFGRDYFFYRRPRQLEAHKYYQYRNNQPCNVLYPAVAEWVFLVGLLPRELESRQRYHRRGRVRKVVNRVGDNCHRPRDYAHGKFARNQNNVEYNSRNARKQSAARAHRRVVRAALRNE